MHWLFLILAVLALVMALTTTSLALAMLGIVAALVLAVVWLLQMLSNRVGGAARDEMQILSPDELRRLAERNRTGDTGPAGPGTDPERSGGP